MFVHQYLELTIFFIKTKIDSKTLLVFTEPLTVFEEYLGKKANNIISAVCLKLVNFV